MAKNIDVALGEVSSASLEGGSLLSGTLWGPDGNMGFSWKLGNIVNMPGIYFQISSEYIQDLCARLFSAPMQQSLDITKPGMVKPSLYFSGNNLKEKHFTEAYYNLFCL